MEPKQYGGSRGFTSSADGLELMVAMPEDSFVGVVFVAMLCSLDVEMRRVMWLAKKMRRRAGLLKRSW